MFAARRAACLLALAVCPDARAATPVDSAAALAAAVRDAADGATVEVAAGTFELSAPLELKPGVTLKGAGMDKTILTHAPGWQPTTKALPDPEMTAKGLDATAYLILVKDKAANVTVSDLTVRGPRLHGAVFGTFNPGLHLHHLRIENTRWCGVRTFGMTRARIHDCEFVDAGGRWDRSAPGTKGGITGGAIFAVWMADSDISDNRFTRTQAAPEREFYGVKVRQAKRCRVHHNTIHANFSLEFPFDNDEDVEVDHNVLRGAVSIPKHAGGPVPKSGRTFHVHHNYFTDSYSIEFVRNGVEVDHNLFDFDPAADHGNLISAFGSAPAKGPAKFHNNLVSNPGRGVVWMNEPFSNLEVRNNHVVARPTKTPRTDGLFGFNSKCDFKTITLKDNVFECVGPARPLFRNKESYGAAVENNTLTNVSDAAKLANPKADRPAGPEAPLKFACGVSGELAVDGWKATPAVK